MTQALATRPLAAAPRDRSDRHEVRDPKSGQLCGWISAQVERCDPALRRALMGNGFLLVTTPRR